MANTKNKIKDIVGEMLSGFLAENGLEIYNVEFLKEGKDWFLRVYIDKVQDTCENGEELYVSTDDCEMVSRYLSEKLDEEDPIEQNYYLEVCSPGMDRQLIRSEDFKRYAGRLVDVSLFKPFEGTKKFTEVTLIELVGDKLVIAEAKNQSSNTKKCKKAGNKKTSKNGKIVEDVALPSTDSAEAQNSTRHLEIPFDQVSKVNLSVIF